ncbi:unnamed protein product, partial [Mesorhabditis spiculigera]
MGIFKLLIVGASPIRSANESQPDDLNRLRRAVTEACLGARPFVCYSFDKLGQDYPAWLQTSDAQKESNKCSSCDVTLGKECYVGEVLNADPPHGKRLKCDECRPQFCEADKMPAADCVAPVKTPGDKANPQLQHGGRVKRQGSSLPTVSYPRCIKTDGLPEDQKAIVKADGLLDCERNPFYKELGLESLTVTKLPLCSGVDSNKKFCQSVVATEPTTNMPNTALTDEGLLLMLTSSPLALVGIGVGAAEPGQAATLNDQTGILYEIPAYEPTKPAAKKSAPNPTQQPSGITELPALFGTFGYPTPDYEWVENYKAEDPRAAGGVEVVDQEPLPEAELRTFVTSLHGSVTPSRNPGGAEPNESQKTMVEEAKVSQKEMDDAMALVPSALERLFDYRKAAAGEQAEFTVKEVLTLLIGFAGVQLKEKTLIAKIDGQTTMVGDIHGQWDTLQRVVSAAAHRREHRDPALSTGGGKILFLGDIVDRDVFCMECMLMIMVMKITYPDKVFLLRGNHETAHINRQYGFFDELVGRYPLADAKLLWTAFNRVFNLLPLCALVGGERRGLFVVHAGFGPKFEKEGLDALKDVPYPLSETEAWPQVMDMIWSDPEPLADQPE